MPEGDSSTGPKKSRLRRDEPPLASERRRKRDRFGKGERKGLWKKREKERLVKKSSFYPNIIVFSLC